MLRLCFFLKTSSNFLLVIMMALLIYWVSIIFIYFNEHAINVGINLFFVNQNKQNYRKKVEVVKDGDIF